MSPRAHSPDPLGLSCAAVPHIVESQDDLSISIRRRSSPEPTFVDEQRMTRALRASLSAGERPFCFRLASDDPLISSAEADGFQIRTQFKSFSQTAEVLVGRENERFLLHKDLLTRHSPFFAAALNGAFAESASGTVCLPDVETKYFEHVVLWIYTQNLEASKCFFKDGKPTYFTLLDLYSLADQLDLEGMRNALIDRVAELAEQTNSVPTPSDTNILYESIRGNAPMRKLVLDLFAFKKTDALIATHPDEWHPTFLRELVCKLKRPGVASLERHDIRPWKPIAWHTTKACQVCKTVLKPMLSGNICVNCRKAFCCACVVRGEDGALNWGFAERECKPWLRGMCAYHEHVHTKLCRMRV